MELVLSGDGFDAQRAYGADLAAAVVVPRVLDTLLPDGVDALFRTTLEDAARDANSPSDAARDVTALVLTAPEFHLT
jgi:hypothetical protein